MENIIIDESLLNTPAEPLQFIDKDGYHKEACQEIINKLDKVLIANVDLVAIAAPQIGINKRIFGIKFANNDIRYFINPIITKKTGLVISPETCCSLPGKEILIGRPKEITAIYYTKEFKYEENKFIDIAARVFDQMTQLLDGVLPSDLGLVSSIETDGKFTDLSEEEMNQACDIWRKFISVKLLKAEEEIKSNEELEKQYNQLKFSEDVINGRTQVITENPKIKHSTKQLKAINQAKLKSFLRRKH